MSRALLLSALLCSLGLAGPSSAEPTADEIRACMRRNFPERTSLQTVEVESTDRVGGSRKLTARLHWKRFPDGRPRVMLRVDAPTDLRGAAYLMISGEPEDAMYTYAPSLDRVRRITSKTIGGKLWGTDFSYEDVKRVQGIGSDGALERLPDGEVAGRKVWVVASQLAPDAGSEYTRIVFHVDPETCVSLRTEFVDAAHGELRKVMTVDPAQVTREGERWIARLAEMHDRRDETTSRLRVAKVQNDVELSDGLFNPTLLPKQR
jgi:hypothetical protein